MSRQSETFMSHRAPHVLSHLLNPPPCPMETVFISSVQSDDV